MEKIYSDLGKALQAMDYDMSRSNIRRRGPNRAYISTESISPEEFRASAASVDYYPDHTSFDESSVFFRDVSAIDGGGRMHDRYMDAASRQASEMVYTATNLVDQVSSGAGKTMKEKFEEMTPTGKVAVGAGLYFGGKAALSMVPMKYLIVGAVAYFLSQKKAEASTAVEGLY